MKSKKAKNKLQKIVDERGIGDVLGMLANICFTEGQDLLEEDAYTSKLWYKIGMQIDRIPAPRL